MTIRYLTTAEAAQLIGVSTSTMHTLITEPGGPPVLDIGRNGRRRIRIADTDLHAWMQTRHRDTPSRSA